MPICRNAPKTRGTYICNSALRSIIPYQARPRPNRPNTRNIDYRASAPLLQRRHRGRNTKKHALDIHGETLVELRLRHLRRRLVPIARARVVDHDVQSAELLLGRTNERLPRVGFGDAACDGGDVVGNIRGREVLCQAVAVHIGGHNFAAFGDEEVGCCEAEARCGACSDAERD
jgi:hypothetical protein